VWVNLWRAGEYPVTFHLPTPIPDAVFDPDFDNEVEVEIDPAPHAFPDANRSNNVLPLWGTTLG
jgi:hypothetical protein